MARRTPILPEFNVWNTMIQRCTNPRATNYPRYGAKGVTVCERWRNSFADFLADMGPRPGPRHTLERIENAKGYELGNVRWATYSEQQRNTTRTIFVEFRGQRRCLRDIGEETGTPYPRLFYRYKAGWPIEKAVSIRAWGTK